MKVITQADRSFLPSLKKAALRGRTDGAGFVCRRLGRHLVKRVRAAHQVGSHLGCGIEVGPGAGGAPEVNQKPIDR